MTDFRLCTPGASVSFVQARMGLAPCWGGARRLVELVGRRKALQLLLTCSKLGSQEGAELGYFDAVLGGAEATGQAEQWLLGHYVQLNSPLYRCFCRKSWSNRCECSAVPQDDDSQPRSGDGVQSFCSSLGGTCTPSN